MMQKNDHDWTFRFGEFDVGDGYTIEIGYVSTFTTMYIRVWHEGNFYVGAALHAFEHKDKAAEGWPGEVIIDKIKDLPPNIHGACMKCVERVKNLRAFI